ncbi:MAG: C_GCAxxG_C_C family protein [Erysipelotrichaceae bacterium]|nr:C_GCAxxG_C_C family protein [Erysipelotrichaceae bacterium]
MSQYLEHSKQLRARTDVHYNCNQAVFIPFAAALGIDETTAMAIGANFGAGMRMAATCGAITGGLMALGLYGIDDPKIVNQFYRELRQNHQNCLDCADLLRINKETGTPKKVHCDNMVFECVELVEKILRDQNKIS